MTDHRATRFSVVTYENMPVDHRATRVGVVTYETFPAEHRVSRMGVVTFQTVALAPPPVDAPSVSCVT